MASQFKNSNGVWLLNEIFFERTNADKTNVIYTLKDEAHNGYPSLYEAYMACNDPTEYSFAIQYLGGWAHWQSLQTCSWFKPYLERWREELHIRAKSQALAKVMETAKGGSKDSFTAQKYLIEKGYDKAAPQTKGRPTKEQISSAAKQIAEEEKRASDDLARLTVN